MRHRIKLWDSGATAVIRILFYLWGFTLGVSVFVALGWIP